MLYSFINHKYNFIYFLNIIIIFFFSMNHFAKVFGILMCIFINDLLFRDVCSFFGLFYSVVILIRNLL